MSTDKRAVQRRFWRRRNKGRSENYQASRVEEYSHIGRNKSSSMGKHKQKNQLLDREESKMVHIANKIPKEEDMSFTTSHSTPKAKSMKSMTRSESRNQTKRRNGVDEISYSKDLENVKAKCYELPHSIEFLSLLLPENFSSSHKSSDDGSTSSSSTNSMYSFSSNGTIMAKERIEETIKIVANIESHFICSPLSPEPLAEPSNNDMHMNVDFLLESKEEELAEFANRSIRTRQYDDAILIYESVLEIYSKKRTDHPLVTKSLHNLGIVYVLKGSYKDALKCCNKALKSRRKHSPTDHIGAASSLSELGIINFALENFNKALEIFREALNIYSKHTRYIHRSSRMAIILNNIACIHFSLGKLDASIATFGECLNLMKRNIGAVNSLKVPRMMFNTSIVLSNTAIAFAKQYDSNQAVTIMEEALLIQQSILPDTHRVIISTSRHLYGNKDEDSDPSKSSKSSKFGISKKNKVKSYPNTKHFPKTPKVETDVLEMLPLGELNLENNTIKSIRHHLSIQSLPNLLRKEASSKRHYRWVDVRKDKANDIDFSSILQKATAYTEKGKFQRAVEFLSKVMEGSETKCGDVPHILSSIHYVIGLVFLHSSQYTEALKHFTKSLKIRSSLLEKDHNDVRASQTMIAISLMATNDFESACSKWEKLLRGTRQKFGYKSGKVALQLVNVGICHYELGGALTASKMMEEAVEILRGLPPPKNASNQMKFSIVLARSLTNLAHTKCRLNDYGSAIVSLDETLEIQEKIYGKDHNAVQQTLSSLGLCMAKTNYERGCQKGTLESMTRMYVEMLRS